MMGLKMASEGKVPRYSKANKTWVWETYTPAKEVNREPELEIKATPDAHTELATQDRKAFEEWNYPEDIQQSRKAFRLKDCPTREIVVLFLNAALLHLQKALEMFPPGVKFSTKELPETSSVLTWFSPFGSPLGTPEVQKRNQEVWKTLVDDLAVLEQKQKDGMAVLEQKQKDGKGDEDDEDDDEASQRTLSPHIFHADVQAQTVLVTRQPYLVTINLSLQDSDAWLTNTWFTLCARHAPEFERQRTKFSLLVGRNADKPAKLAELNSDIAKMKMASRWAAEKPTWQQMLLEAFSLTKLPDPIPRWLPAPAIFHRLFAEYCTNWLRGTHEGANIAARPWMARPVFNVRLPGNTSQLQAAQPLTPHMDPFSGIPTEWAFPVEFDIALDNTAPDDDTVWELIHAAGRPRAAQIKAGQESKGSISESQSGDISYEAAAFLWQVRVGALRAFLDDNKEGWTLTHFPTLLASKPVLSAFAIAEWLNDNHQWEQAVSKHPQLAAAEAKEKKHAREVGGATEFVNINRPPVKPGKRRLEATPSAMMSLGGESTSQDASSSGRPEKKHKTDKDTTPMDTGEREKKKKKSKKDKKAGGAASMDTGEREKKSKKDKKAGVSTRSKKPDLMELPEESLGDFEEAEEEEEDSVDEAEREKDRSYRVDIADAIERARDGEMDDEYYAVVLEKPEKGVDHKPRELKRELKEAELLRKRDKKIMRLLRFELWASPEQQRQHTDAKGSDQIAQVIAARMTEVDRLLADNHELPEARVQSTFLQGAGSNNKDTIGARIIKMIDKMKAVKAEVLWPQELEQETFNRRHLMGWLQAHSAIFSQKLPGSQRSLLDVLARLWGPDGNSVAFKPGEVHEELLWSVQDATALRDMLAASLSPDKMDTGSDEKQKATTTGAPTEAQRICAESELAELDDVLDNNKQEEGTVRWPGHFVNAWLSSVQQAIVEGLVVPTVLDLVARYRSPPASWDKDDQVYRVVRGGGQELKALVHEVDTMRSAQKQRLDTLAAMGHLKETELSEDEVRNTVLKTLEGGGGSAMNTAPDGTVNDLSRRVVDLFRTALHDTTTNKAGVVVWPNIEAFNVKKVLFDSQAADKSDAVLDLLVLLDSTADKMKDQDQLSLLPRLTDRLRSSIVSRDVAREAIAAELKKMDNAKATKKQRGKNWNLVVDRDNGKLRKDSSVRVEWLLDEAFVLNSLLKQWQEKVNILIPDEVINLIAQLDSDVQDGLSGARHFTWPSSLVLSIINKDSEFLETLHNRLDAALLLNKAFDEMSSAGVPLRGKTVWEEFKIKDEEDVIEKLPAMLTKLLDTGGKWGSWKWGELNKMDDSRLQRIVERVPVSQLDDANTNFAKMILVKRQQLPRELFLAMQDESVPMRKKTSWDNAMAANITAWAKKFIPLEVLDEKELKIDAFVKGPFKRYLKPLATDQLQKMLRDLTEEGAPLLSKMMLEYAPDLSDKLNVPDYCRYRFIQHLRMIVYETWLDKTGSTKPAEETRLVQEYFTSWTDKNTVYRGDFKEVDVTSLTTVDKFRGLVQEVVGAKDHRKYYTTAWMQDRVEKLNTLALQAMADELPLVFYDNRQIPIMATVRFEMLRAELQAIDEVLLLRLEKKMNKLRQEQSGLTKTYKELEKKAALEKKSKDNAQLDAASKKLQEHQDLLDATRDELKNLVKAQEVRARRFLDWPQLKTAVEKERLDSESKIREEQKKKQLAMMEDDDMDDDDYRPPSPRGL